MALQHSHFSFHRDYAPVNGLRMYYEIHGNGFPLVLIHGGGSTIETNFGKAIPLLSRNHQVIAMELQAHGRTNDRDAESTFEQDADDVAALLRHLGIGKANVLGFSNGGTTTLQLAIRHPQLVNRMVLCSALAKRHGVPDWFWDIMAQASLDNMPEPLKAGYLKVAPDPTGLPVMHDRDAKRMLHFTDIPDEALAGIDAPALIITGDKDVITPEHAIELNRKLNGSTLAIVPGGHGAYIGEITTLGPDFRESDLVIPLIDWFLSRH